MVENITQIGDSDLLITINQHSFLDAFEQEATVIDLGGHKGGFSKNFLRKFPCKKILIVEANPQLIPIIEQETKAYFAKTQIIHAAIGTTSATNIDFYICDNPEASLADKSLNKKKNIIDTIQVKMLTLNDLYKYIGTQKVDLMKVDIEGMEWEILQKLTSEDYDRIDQITVEFHDFFDPNFETKTLAVIERLKSLGYCFINGNTKHTKHYDCLFCKPKFYLKYLEQKVAQLNNEKILLNQQLATEKHKKTIAEYQEVIAIRNSVSWKITAPLRWFVELLKSI